ncbi:MAG: hemerythrin domain-containing protein [bacterium]|nr:hemerythrin domain-containing protein [bacterium]
MTDPINTLMNEHRVIERVLDALEQFCESLAMNGKEDRAALARFAEFFQRFADSFHHGKEEDILFAAMTQHGFSSDFGPVAVMLHEHEQGRGAVKILRSAGANPNADWDEDERNCVIAATREYIVMLRAHIQKEDQILYPMAQQHIPYAVMTNMGRTFAEYDGEKTADGTAQRLLDLAEELGARYAVV